MTILPQEVWFADFPFDDDPTQSKDRPVIVLHVDDESCRVLSMKVTSSEPRTEFEIELFDWAQIPLPHKSTADASAVRNLPKSKFRRRVGRLSNADWGNVTAFFRAWLASFDLNS